MKNKTIAMTLVMLSCSSYAHYQVENVKTTATIFSFELIHKYLEGHDTNHANTCRKTYTNNKLESCTLNYKVTSGGNDKVIKTGFVDLRGDGSFDEELMSATTHYNALRVAEAHGVDLNQLVEIQRNDITSLTGGNNKYTVSTSSAGRVCDANSSACKDYEDSGYTKDTLDFTTKTDLQVACAFSNKDISVKTSLSEDNLYLYDGSDNQKILSYNYDVDNVLVECVNWLSTSTSNNVTLKYDVLEKTVDDGDTRLTCKLFGNSTGTTLPVSSTNKITISGFSTKYETFKIPEAFLGFYVSSPSGSAQTSVLFDCNFPLSTEIN
ncbi:heme utilization protein [Morganella morganii]|jgi:hypothetical protein|uniref:heme utilization protein n=1 Tax=Morganella TaxID=581 RepID=UPI00370A3C2E